MGRRIKTCLDRLHPDYSLDQQLKQDEELATHLENRKIRQFNIDEPVYVRSYGATSPWVPATIQRQTGPVSYEAKTSEGQVIRRHVHLMAGRTPSEEAENSTSPTRVISEEPVASSYLPSQPLQNTPRTKRTIKPPAYMKDYVTS